MKLRCLLLLVGIAAMSNLEAKKVNGKIIFERDTVDVVFDMPTIIFSKEINYTNIQYRIKYYDKNGVKTLVRPGQAKEYIFLTNEQEELKMVSCRNSARLGKLFSKRPYIFLRQEMAGELKVFNYHYTVRYPVPTLPGLIHIFRGFTGNRRVLQKGDNDLKRVRGISFRRDMTRYFSDCPSLSELIKNKDFVKDDLEDIVTYYNSKCKRTK